MNAGTSFILPEWLEISVVVGLPIIGLLLLMASVKFSNLLSAGMAELLNSIALNNKN